MNHIQLLCCSVPQQTTVTRAPMSPLANSPGCFQRRVPLRQHLQSPLEESDMSVSQKVYLLKFFKLVLFFRHLCFRTSGESFPVRLLFKIKPLVGVDVMGTAFVILTDIATDNSVSVSRLTKLFLFLLFGCFFCLGFNL